MTQSLAVAILGASGRMGRALIEATLRNSALRLAAAIARDDSAALGVDAGALIGRPVCGIAITADRPAALASAAVLVDFTQPAVALAALADCVATGKAIVIGTTGFNAAQKEEIAAAARVIPICMAANYSIGVNVCLKLSEIAAQLLGSNYDIEIIEAHHRHKVDAPSGTALALGEAVAGALGIDLRSNAVYSREGQIGARVAGTIGFATVRGGDVIGEHSVLFLGDGERVEISHKASSRGNFAVGALRAAQWLASQPPGLYSMRDVLGLNG